MAAWVSAHARNLSLCCGTAVVALWTLLRHISNGVNFDVVGQIGLAEQWANGQMAGAQLGATNYLLKIPFYLLVNAVHALTPMNRILLAALVFNILTFVLLFVLYEKIMDLYGVKHRTWLYLAMAWLATIAGNVFWVDYANSRNLETVGGILFIYLALKYLKYQRNITLLIMGVTGSVVFFADPIQLYVCGAGVSIFVTVRMVLKPSRTNALRAIAISGITATGYLGSQALQILAQKFLHVSLLVPPNTSPLLSIDNLAGTLKGLATSTLKIFGADFAAPPYQINSIRELLNGIVVTLLAYLLIKTAFSQNNRKLFGMMLAVIATNYFVYIASGQVLQWETSRYLVMVPLLVLVLIAICGDRIQVKNRQRIQYAWLLLILVGATMLVGALAISWPARHAKDAHIGELVSFMQKGKYKYAVSSRGAGITTTYFSEGKAIVLPMACGSDHKLSPTTLFYDSAAFQNFNNYNQDVPVILQGNEIRFGANVCTKSDIISQFGRPEREQAIPGVGSAIIYKASNIHGSKRKVTVITNNSNLGKLTDCKAGTLDVIAAHPDDDLLFMNPDLAKQITNKCVRSVFVTAGDDGRHSDYWKDRQRGIEAAYASLMGVPNVWSDGPTTINNHAIQSRSLATRPNVGLIFLHLPDGGVDGKGFASTGHVSLEEIASQNNKVLRTIDGNTGYTYAELTNLISSIVVTDKPDTIYTHLSTGRLSVGDHSDHHVVGRIAIRARSIAKSTAEVSRYVGYPSNGLPVNLTPTESLQKRQTFYAYASSDSAICISANACSIEATYGKYFSRSYKIQQYRHTATVNKRYAEPATPKQIILLKLLQDLR